MRWTRFKNLPQKTKMIIRSEAEGESIDYIPPNSFWKVGNVPIDLLPETSIEIDLRDPRYTREDYAHDKKRVDALKESIARRGYDPDRPILFEEERVNIVGGHHRLKASRELRDEGKLRNPVIPVAMMKEGRLQSIWERRMSKRKEIK